MKPVQVEAAKESERSAIGPLVTVEIDIAFALSSMQSMGLIDFSWRMLDESRVSHGFLCSVELKLGLL
jgi:hypothetical protein